MAIVISACVGASNGNLWTNPKFVNVHVFGDTHKGMWKDREIARRMSAEEAASTVDGNTTTTATSSHTAKPTASTDAGAPQTQLVLAPSHNTSYTALPIIAAIPPQVTGHSPTVSAALCTGSFFDEIIELLIGKMEPYVDAWMDGGQIAYKTSAINRVIFTRTIHRDAERKHVQAIICWESKAFARLDALSSCAHCWKSFKSEDVAKSLAEMTYLGLKCKRLEALAMCACVSASVCVSRRAHTVSMHDISMRTYCKHTRCARTVSKVL